MDKFLDINLIATIFLSSVYPLFTKYAVSDIHPDYASVIATITWMAGLMIIASFQLKTVPLDISLKSILPLLFLGVMGATMTFFGFRATATLPVNCVVIARSITPAFSILAAYFLFNDKLTFGQWVGVVFILIGTVFVVVFKCASENDL